MPENDLPHAPRHAETAPRIYNGAVVAVPAPGYKSPAVAVILSLFFPGVGSIYAGNAGKGVTLLVAYIVSVGLSFVVIGIPFAIWFWIWGMVAGANDAAKANARLMSHGR